MRRPMTFEEAEAHLKDFASKLRMYDPETDQIVVPTDFFEWAEYCGSGKSVIAKDTLPNGVEVSTVFIGHMNFDDESKAFETMVTEPTGGTEFRKYKTPAEAREGHAALVQFYSKDDWDKDE